MSRIKNIIATIYSALRIDQYPTENTILLLSGIKRAFFKQQPFIYITSFPKGGSTYLRKLLLKLTEYKYCSLTYKSNDNEREAYLPKIIDNYNHKVLTQQHSRATSPIIEIFNGFEIKPIILTRNIFDVVISLRDHLYNEGPSIPMCYLNKKFYEFEETVQYDLIIDLAVPWYFNFYVSWYDATIANKKVEGIWVTYEELISNKEGILNKILKFYDIEKSKNEITQAIEDVKKASTRLNKGVVGRGENKLTDAQKEKIKSYKQFYPWVDFTRMGI